MNHDVDELVGHLAESRAIIKSNKLIKSNFINGADPIHLDDNNIFIWSSPVDHHPLKFTLLMTRNLRCLVTFIMINFGRLLIDFLYFTFPTLNNYFPLIFDIQLICVRKSKSRSEFSCQVVYDPLANFNLFIVASNCTIGDVRMFASWFMIY